MAEVADSSNESLLHPDEELDPDSHKKYPCSRKFVKQSLALQQIIGVQARSLCNLGVR